MAIRPQSFDDFHGQPGAIGMLRVAVRSALARKKPLGHVLIVGSAGLGKTTLSASVLPTELGVKVQSLVCSAIEKPADLIPTLTRMKAREILFLDEVHAMNRLCHETLFGVLEDFKIDVRIGDGKDAQILSVEIEPFTVLAATTRSGLLSEPFRDRFKHTINLVLYNDDDMAKVLQWTATQYEVTLPDPTLLIPACHGTARYASRLIEACIDTIWCGDVTIPSLDLTPAIIEATLRRLGYAPNGLSKAEVALLRRLASSSGPVGLNTLAAVLDEEADTVESVYEPWLLQLGLLEKTPSGRKITVAGKKALKATQWPGPPSKSN
jgi:Holliday junction DNA helicase RuvB